MEAGSEDADNIMPRLECGQQCYIPIEVGVPYQNKEDKCLNWKEVEEWQEYKDRLKLNAPYVYRTCVDFGKVILPPMPLALPASSPWP